MVHVKHMLARANVRRAVTTTSASRSTTPPPPKSTTSTSSKSATSSTTPKSTSSKSTTSTPPPKSIPGHPVASPAPISSPIHIPTTPIPTTKPPTSTPPTTPTKPPPTLTTGGPVITTSTSAVGPTESPSSSSPGNQPGGNGPVISSIGGLGGSGLIPTSIIGPGLLSPTEPPNPTAIPIESGGGFRSHSRSIAPHAMEEDGGQAGGPTLAPFGPGDSTPLPTDGLGGGTQLAVGTSVVTESDDDGTTFFSITQTIAMPSIASSSSSGNSNKQGGFQTWIVGVIIAGTAILVVAIMGLVYYRRWKRRLIIDGFQEIQYAGGETVHSTIIVPRPVDGTDDGRSLAEDGHSVYSEPHPPSLSMSYQEERIRPRIIVTTTNNSIYNYPLNSPYSTPTPTSTSFSNSPTSYISYGYSSGSINEKGTLPTLWENPFEDEGESASRDQQESSTTAVPYQAAIREWAQGTKGGAQRPLSRDSGGSDETAPPSYRSQATS